MSASSATDRPLDCIGGVWVLTVSEIPLEPGTVEPAVGLVEHIVEVLAMPADTVRSTRAAMDFARDHNYIDAGRKVLVRCECRSVEVRR